MVCLSWWLLLALLLAAGVLGFLAYFVWQWWLLSRPNAKSG
jgi:hypothetical protein